MGSYKYMKIIGKNKKTQVWEVLSDNFINGGGYYTHFGSSFLPGVKLYDIPNLDLNLFLNHKGYVWACEGIVASDSFDKLIEEHFKCIEENIRKKVKWEALSSSLEYLKLTSEEKENVQESFEFEEEGYNETAIQRLSAIKGLLETAEETLDYDSVFGLCYDSGCYSSTPA